MILDDFIPWHNVYDVSTAVINRYLRNLIEWIQVFMILKYLLAALTCEILFCHWDIYFIAIM